MNADVNRTHRLAIWGIGILVALNIGLLSVIWYNQWYRQPIPPPHERRPNPDDFIAKELGATEDQARTFRALRDQQLQQTDSLKTVIHELSLRMVDEIFSATPDSGRIAALADSIGAGHAQLERRLFNHFRELKALCGPDQQNRLRQLLVDVLRRSQLPFPPPGLSGNPRPGPPGDRQTLLPDDRPPLPGDNPPGP
jgi:periplasmic protein CpxP/Spy